MKLACTHYTPPPVKAKMILSQSQQNNRGFKTPIIYMSNQSAALIPAFNKKAATNNARANLTKLTNMPLLLFQMRIVKGKLHLLAVAIIAILLASQFNNRISVLAIRLTQSRAEIPTIPLWHDSSPFESVSDEAVYLYVNFTPRVMTSQSTHHAALYTHCTASPNQSHWQASSPYHKAS